MGCGVVKWIVLLFAISILYADTSIIKSEISKIISEIEATNTAIHIKKIQNPFLNYKKPEVFASVMKELAGDEFDSLKKFLRVSDF